MDVNYLLCVQEAAREKLCWKLVVWGVLASSPTCDWTSHWVSLNPNCPYILKWNHNNICMIAEMIIYSPDLLTDFQASDFKYLFDSSNVSSDIII